MTGGTIMLTIEAAIRKSLVSCAVLVAFLCAVPSQAAVTKAELAGHPLGTYPFFHYVKAINSNSAVHVAIDPTRFPAIVGQTCNIYVVTAKKTIGWNNNNTLTDVTIGGMQTQTFIGGTIQAQTFQVTVPSELSGAAGTGLGVGYDVVLDCNQNGLLDGNDYIDGRNNESGFYIVHDTTAAGPLAVTTMLHAVSGFGIPASHQAEKVYFPTNISTMGQLPLIVVSHGNGHNYLLYDHIGNHLASYGYIVMTHANNTVPGSFSASTTTLGHTDAFINDVATGAIPALFGHLNANKIVWVGHSRGGEGVTIAYDRVFDLTYVPVNYDKTDIKLIDSMLPTDWVGTADSNPHDANYHLWTASGDADVHGGADCELCQTYHLHDRSTGHRQSTTVQGAGHGDFHTGGGVFDGPCPLGVANTNLIQLGLLLPLVKRYVDDNIPSIDFLTRQYETFRPIGAPTNVCAVVTNEYYDASVIGTVVLDDYQTQTGTNISSSGGSVTFNVDNLVEGKLDDNNLDFTWNPADPFNGATQVGNTDWSAVRNDTGRGVVFDWTGTDRFYEWAVPAGEQNFANDLYLSLRGAQGTRHPNTLAVGGDLTFTVALRDSVGTTSAINIGAYGGGLEQPFQRNGGWHNEMETIRIRLTDFLNNGSGLNLGSIVAVRLNVGPLWGSPQGRVVIDDLVLSNDRAVYDGADNGDPHIRTVSGENYDFHSAGEFTLLRDGDMEIQVRQTPVPSAPPVPNAHTGLTSCPSVNTAVAARVSGHRVTYQPGLAGQANPSGMELRIDGKLVDINAVQSVPLGGGARIASASGGIEIDFADGTTLLIVPGWWGSHSVWYLNLNVLNTPATEGIMGFIPSGSWLPTLPDGSSMGPRPASAADRYDALNRKFADAWRVSNATSLFDYAPGMGTEDFTNRAWPAENATSCNIPNAQPVQPIEKETARQLCAEIVNKDDRANCEFDVALTGEPNFAKTYLQSQTLVKRATETEVFPEKESSRSGESVDFVAVVKHKKTGERIAPAEGQETGAVQFTLDGARLGKPVQLDAFGRATLTTSRLKPGKHQIGAMYVPAKAGAGLLPSVSAGTVHHVVAREGR
jgi:Bacterial Ig-like domain (group 3)/Platelet-activating factor acetylhydrolase, isoform II